MSEQYYGKTIRIGREPGNDIVLDIPSVSRHHATISFNGSSYCIRDNNSANGVYVNGNRVSNAEIQRSDRITLGSNVDLSWRQIESSFNALGTNPQPVYQAPPYYQPNDYCQPQSKGQSNATLWIGVSVGVALLLLGGLGLLFMLNRTNRNSPAQPGVSLNPKTNNTVEYPARKENETKATATSAPVTEFIRIYNQGRSLNEHNFLNYCENYEKGRGSYDLIQDLYSRIDPDKLADILAEDIALRQGYEPIPSDLRVTMQGSSVAILNYTDSGANRLLKQIGSYEYEIDPDDLRDAKEEFMSYRIYMIKENGRWKRYLHENDSERQMIIGYIAIPAEEPAEVEEEVYEPEVDEFIEPDN